MKYIIIGNNKEGIFEKSTQKLFQALDIPLEREILIAPDHMQEGLFLPLYATEWWVSSWVNFFQNIQSQQLTPLFIEEGSYISGLLALKTLKEEDAFATYRKQIKDIEILGTHTSLSAFLTQNQQIQAKLKRNWQGFKIAICNSAFSRLRQTIEGDFFQKLQHKLTENLGVSILNKNNHHESITHITHFNPDVALKENARIYYEMVDLGIDFILTFSANTFSFFEKHNNRIKKTAQRDTINVPFLHLSEMFLLLLGEKTFTHKIPLGMI